MEASSVDAAEKNDRQRINRVIDYIHRHSAEDLSLTKLAGQACLSKFHFHRIFQAAAGETVSRYVRRIRLEQAACRLAADSAVSIAQIAESCGFSSQQNFARCFKAHFGHAPTSFRKNPALRKPALFTPPGPAPSGTNALFPVEVREMPSRRVAYIRDIGPYYAPSNFRAFDRLFEWAINKGLISSGNVAPIAVAWSDPDTTAPRECVFDACLTVSGDIQESGEVAIQTLSGGKCAVLHCEIERKNLPGAIQSLRREWLSQSRYRRDDRPFFTIYYNNPGGNPRQLAILDLCLPVKPL